MTTGRELRIAHISDLHFTSGMTWPPAGDTTEPWAVRLKALEQDLAQVQPDLLLVTGDVADNPTWDVTLRDLRSAWGNARSYLEAVGKSLFGERLDGRIAVVPGNHDAKVIGNVRRDELERLASSRVFRLLRLPLRWAIRRELRRRGLGAVAGVIDSVFEGQLDSLVPILPLEQDEGAAFEEAFRPYAHHGRVEASDLFLFCVNSNSPADTMLNFAQGVVPGSEILGLRQQATEWKKQLGPGFENAIKLLLVHHHPLPMPPNEGRGGFVEGDQFHLLRNAGGLLDTCAEIGIDIVLHGHKHSAWCSTITFPGRQSRPVVVIGAGSVQKPHEGNCSYNLLRRSGDGAWHLEVRSRPDQLEGSAAYVVTRESTFISAEDGRRRRHRSGDVSVAVRQVDRLVDIDEGGDVTIWQLLWGLAPLSGELTEYDIQYGNSSNRATWEALNFFDEAKEPAVVKGRLEVSPPARMGSAANVEFGLRGVGVYTFSQEYCQRYNGRDREEFVFYVGRRVLNTEAHVDITLPCPDVLPFIRPRVDVLKIVRFPADRARPWHEWMQSGCATPDERETEACQAGLRWWRHLGRILFEVRDPLPGRAYRISWSLPQDEFEILDDDFRLIRDTVRESIRLFKRVLLGLPSQSGERDLVEQALAGLGAEVREHLQTADDLQVDIAVDSGSTIDVVAGVSIPSGSGSWVPLSSNPKCALGETLRGKAFLQRQPRSYAPGVPDTEKDSNRHALESHLRHQLAMPIVYPPALPYWPRVCVVTFSSSAFRSPLFTRLLEPEEIGWLSSRAHEVILRLAAHVSCAFPELPSAV